MAGGAGRMTITPCLKEASVTDIRVTTKAEEVHPRHLQLTVVLLRCSRSSSRIFVAGAD